MEQTKECFEFGTVQVCNICQCESSSCSCETAEEINNNAKEMRKNDI